MHILFVCTGNRYRSPIAEGFARRAIAARGTGWTTSSAGILDGGLLMAPDALRAVEDADPSMAAHRSRVLKTDQVRASDLVIGMARNHVREVVVLEQDAWSRTFTLKELVRRGRAIGPRHDGQELEQWLRLAGAGRQRKDLQGASLLDDVEDPVGRPAAEVRQIARVIQSAVADLVTLLAPPP